MDKSFKTDLTEILKDKDDRRLLALEDKNGELGHYKQIATIKKGEDIYCLLKPLNNSAFANGESILFKVTQCGDQYGLSTKIDKNEKQIIIDKIKSSIARLRVRP